MAPLAKSNAFIGMEQYQKSLPRTHRANPNDSKRKSEESSEFNMHRMAKVQKTSEDASHPRTTSNLQKNQSSSNGKGKSKTAKTKSEKRKTSLRLQQSFNVKIETKFNFNMASKTVISLPLENATYGVGIHVKENYSATKVDCRKKRKISPEPRTNERTKQQKTSNVSSVFENQRVEHSLKINCNGRTVPETTEIKKHKDNTNLIGKTATSAKVTNLPQKLLVKSDAFIGVEQYRERIQTINDEAVQVSEKRKPTSSATKKSENRLVKSNAFIGEQQYLEQIKAIIVDYNTKRNATLRAKSQKPLARSNAFIGVEQYQQRIKVINDGAVHARPKSNSIFNAKKARSKPIVRSNAFIGAEQYQQRIKIINDGASRVSKEIKPTTTRSSEATPHRNSKASPSRDSGEPLNNASKLTLSQKRKKQTESVLAKSQQKKLTMCPRRLFEMEDAVKQWNNYFGTCYSVL